MPKPSLLRPLWVVLALRAAPVLAHAGLPETSNISPRRGSQEDFIAGASFGAVISRDAGRHWRWICSEGMGLGTWRPEHVVWLSGGALLAATGNPLVRSDDGGCTWSAHAFFQDTWVTDLAVHPTDEHRMYVTTGKPLGSNGIYRSEDLGWTWRALLPPSSEARYSALRLSPSNPQRLYASGQDAKGMFLARSDDEGKTWTRRAQPLPELARPYDFVLLGVSAASPEVLWARVSAQGHGQLLESRDGGVTFTRRLETADIISGVELSADGRTTWVSTPVHMYRGREGEDFVELPLPNGNACASRDGDVLYGCGSSWVHAWALARSRDEGSSWEPLLDLKDIQGAHLCPAGTPVQRLCSAQWPQLARVLGAQTSEGGGGTSPPFESPTDPEFPEEKCGCGTSSGVLPALLGLLSVPRRRSRSLGPLRPRCPPRE